MILSVKLAQNKALILNKKGRKVARVTDFPFTRPFIKTGFDCFCYFLFMNL